MPFKIGLGQKRKQILQDELNRIIPEIIRFNVRKIILFGSLVSDSVHKSSDIDLMIVKETDKRFLDRIEEFYQCIRPRVGMDVLIYTPQEFEEMQENSSFMRSVLKKGKVLYEKSE